MMLLFKSFLKKEYILFKRYLFNSLGGVISICILFALIFLGYKGVAGNSLNYGANLEGIIIGYVLWFFGVLTYMTISDVISKEATSGTLEQLYMSSFKFSTILFMITISSFIFNLISILMVLFFSMIITGHFLNIDLISLVPVMIFTLLCFYGIGLMAGGITLFFKKANNILQIVQFLIIGCIIAPINKVPILALLPGSLGSNMINEIMRNKKQLMEFSVEKVVYLAIIGIGYIVLGAIIYKFFEKQAMKKGLLGHY